MEILSQAERFIESQGFHLLTKEGIPKFARCAAESYGNIVYALDDYFVGHPCAKDEDYSASVRLNATGGREWYRYNLVVRPEAQGQHLVGKLLRPMLEYCGQSGRQADLETHSGKDVEIYRHFGFEVVSDAPIPDTDVTHWGMVKQDKSPENR